jgi:glycosyltransferase involved in cell wall biosynthesis
MSTDTLPTVSLLLCVHNGAAYLPACLHSILTQSFTDFELIIIDDASTDDSPAILCQFTKGTGPLPSQGILPEYANIGRIPCEGRGPESVRNSSGLVLAAMNDPKQPKMPKLPRVRLFRNAENLGLTQSLNRGLGLVEGTYIARLDADDTMHPNRLQQQVDFLNAHPDYGIVGSFAQQMDASGKPTSIQKTPVTNAEIQWFSLLSSPFLHPTVMLRKAVLDANDLAYDPTFRTTQDYDLWTRMLCVTKGYNIPLPLTHLRIHTGAISHTKKSAQFTNHQTIACRTIRERCGVELSPAVIASLLEAFHQPRHTLSRQELWSAIRSYLRLYRAFRKHHNAPAVLKTVLLRVVRAIRP